MGFEDKKDNKVDARKNGRPVSFSTGDGQDFFIDLPNAIPGEEGVDTNDMSAEDIESLIGEINSASAEIEALLREAGIDPDDIATSQFDN